TDCESQAKDAAQSCLDAGTDTTECQSLGQQTLDQCEASCGSTTAETCMEVCEGKAQAKHERLTARGKSEGVAIRKAQDTFRRCVHFGGCSSGSAARRPRAQPGMASR